MIRAWLILAALAVPSCAWAQRPFAMDCTAANLNCGFDTLNEPGPMVTHTRRTGECPNGDDAVRWTHNLGQPHSQYNHGHVLNNGGSAVAQGQTVYFRFRIRPVSPVDLQGSGDVWGDKMAIIGNDITGAGGRAIVFIKDGGSLSQMAVVATKNIALASSVGANVTADAWNTIQIGMTASSTIAAADGVIKFWWNNDNFASPNASRADYVFDMSGTNNWASGTQTLTGALAGTTAGGASPIVYDLCNVEWSDSFDTDFHSNPGGGGGGGATSTRQRPRWRR